MTPNRNQARPAHAPTKENALRGITNEGTKGLENTDVIVSELALTTTKNEPRIDTRLLAQNLGNKHPNVLQLLDRYIDRFQSFGKVMFKTGPSPSGQRERFALLNEDQAYFLLSLSRNTGRVVDLKQRLVMTFRDARRTLDMRGMEYLPAYHAMHDAIKLRANGSPHQRFAHMNANKALNRLAGIGPGQRSTAGPITQSLLTVASALAANAVMEAKDGKGLHECIKAALKPLEAVMQLEAK